MTYPKRAFVLTMTIGADTRQDLSEALNSIAFEIAAEKVTESVTGSYSWGGNYKLEVDESMTHDRYMEELNKVLGRK